MYQDYTNNLNYSLCENKRNSVKIKNNSLKITIGGEADFNFYLAAEYGIKKEDVFIDCLVLTVSAQQEEVQETLKAVRMVKEKLGVKTILGVSNISFGVPNRKALNNTYLNLQFCYFETHLKL